VANTYFSKAKGISSLIAKGEYQMLTVMMKNFFLLEDSKCFLFFSEITAH
jgi:hypothetical protein